VNFEPASVEITSKEVSPRTCGEQTFFCSLLSLPSAVPIHIVYLVVAELYAPCRTECLVDKVGFDIFPYIGEDFDAFISSTDWFLRWVSLRSFSFIVVVRSFLY